MFDKIIVFIDELPELLNTNDKEMYNILNSSLETLTRLSRAVGIHLIMGIQRPDSTIVSGQIKNNVAYRVCGRFADKEPSRIVLNNDIATTLPETKGRFILKDSNYRVVQCFIFPRLFARPPHVIINRLQVKEPKQQEQTPTVKRSKSKPTIPKRQPMQQKAPRQFNFDFSDLRDDSDKV